MSNADKLFYELGYDKKETSRKIIYYIDLPIWKPSITFNKKYKNIKLDLCLPMQELKAINMKCLELGWLGDTNE